MRDSGLRVVPAVPAVPATHVDVEAAPVAGEQPNLEMLLREELIMQERQKYFDSAWPVAGGGL